MYFKSVIFKKKYCYIINSYKNFICNSYKRTGMKIFFIRLCLIFCMILCDEYSYILYKNI